MCVANGRPAPFGSWQLPRAPECHRALVPAARDTSAAVPVCSEGRRPSPPHPIELTCVPFGRAQEEAGQDDRVDREGPACELASLWEAWQPDAHCLGCCPRVLPT